MQIVVFMWWLTLSLGCIETDCVIDEIMLLYNQVTYNRHYKKSKVIGLGMFHKKNHIIKQKCVLYNVKLREPNKACFYHVIFQIKCAFEFA